MWIPKPIPLLNFPKLILYFQYTYPLLKLYSSNTDPCMVGLHNPCVGVTLHSADPLSNSLLKDFEDSQTVRDEHYM